MKPLLHQMLRALALLPLLGQTWLHSETLRLQIASGPFLPTAESLTNYVCPDWFRDAKFGIWAHWGPQSVPMAGDWYARNLYLQGHRQYQHHLEHYGHPSTNGWKDIIPLWRAERFDPDRLMALYKRAGARYFVSMAVHHDNFDLWNSKHHRWNAVQMGPKRDIVGAWQQAARKYGLRFGVSEHLGASYTWFQTAKGADKTGPLAGVPYDGNDAKFWDLYHPPADPHDRGWYSTNRQWHLTWFRRIKDIVDSYQPDLLYTDGGIPFGGVGRSLIAHFYNANLRQHGRLEAVYTCKNSGSGEFIPGAAVEDVERGVLSGIQPRPWQTDTSLGDWFYNTQWNYRPARWIIHLLVDIVSKNGNLLLNVVQRPDGTLDPEVEQALEEMADWIAVHGEAIYATRPWYVFGEGPVRPRGGHFREDFPFTARDIRFTTKGRTLYAIALGWPEDRQIVIRSLASVPGTSTNRIQSVQLLGHPGRVHWSQTTNGLTIRLPDKPVSPHTAAFRITGRNLFPVPFETSPPPVRPDAQGRYILDAAEAELHGDHLRTEERGGRTNIGYWDRAEEWVSWKLQIPQPGRFQIAALCAAANGESRLRIEIAGQSLTRRIPATGSWDDFQPVELGVVEVSAPGVHTLSARPDAPSTWRPINLREVRVLPAP
ncbi:MAG: alpha-L-fucosidase [Limisphaera sp.]